MLGFGRRCGIDDRVRWFGSRIVELLVTAVADGGAVEESVDLTWWMRAVALDGREVVFLLLRHW